VLSYIIHEKLCARCQAKSAQKALGAVFSIPVCVTKASYYINLKIV
jgi:hypothetical protein